jgi:hypothetical protein
VDKFCENKISNLHDSSALEHDDNPGTDVQDVVALYAKKSPSIDLPNHGGTTV